MFNGIIYNTGVIKKIEKTKKSIFLGVKSKFTFKDNEIGSSVSCDGVCLTIVKIKKNMVFFLYFKWDLKKN